VKSVSFSFPVEFDQFIDDFSVRVASEFEFKISKVLIGFLINSYMRMIRFRGFFSHVDKDNIVDNKHYVNNVTIGNKFIGEDVLTMDTMSRKSMHIRVSKDAWRKIKELRFEMREETLGNVVERLIEKYEEGD